MPYTPLPSNAFGGTATTPAFGNNSVNTPSVFSGVNSTTPQTSGNIAQSPFGGLIGGIASGYGYLPPVKTTVSGGTSFNPSLASAYTNTPTPPPVSQQEQGLSQYVTNTNSTPGGGQLTTTSSGTPTGYSPSPFSVNPGNTVSSDAFDSPSSMGDVMNQQKSLQDYVNSVSQANGYSPDYLAAQQGVYNAQSNAAALGVNAAATANQAYGANTANNGAGMNYGSLGGATTDFVGGTIGSEQSQIAMRQAQNAQAQTGANIALNTAQLQRTGNIAGAQAQLQYSPTAVAAQNAQSQYQALSQQYAGINPPPFDPNQDPQAQLSNLHALIAQSPAYQAGFQSTYTTPGGGTGIYSKLNVASGGFQQNADGSYTLVPAAAAALGSANANVVQTQLSNLSNINSAINASTKTLDTTTQFMNQYGLNQSGISILSQIQNSTNKNLDKAGAVAGLNADLNALRADYAQYLIGRGGSVAGTNQEAQDAIPATISPSQLQQVVGQMQQDGKNTADAVSTQVNQALSGITNNNTGQSQSTPTGSGWGSLGD